MFKLCVWNEKEAWLSQIHKDKHTHLSASVFRKHKIHKTFEENCINFQNFLASPL